MLIKLIKTVCFLFEELSQWKRWLKTVERIVSFCNWLLTRNRVTHFFKALIKRKEKKLRPCDFQEWDFFCGSHFLKCHKTFLSLTVKQENHNLPPLFICEYCSHCRWYRLSYGTYACAFPRWIFYELHGYPRIDHDGWMMTLSIHAQKI